MNKENCTNDYNHLYDTKTCVICGKKYCYSCCSSTNVDQGCKCEPDYMVCPECGHDWFEEE